MEVHLGDLVKPALTREGKALQAIERPRRAADANPDSAKACKSLAWAYLTAPAALRDVKAALLLAEKALRLDSGNAMFNNTLGLAYYRSGRYREVVKILGPNLDNQKDLVLAFDLYLLAMSHHQLGETTRGRDYYAWASRWTRAQRGLSAAHLEELNVFQAEATELLGIDKKKD